MDTKVSKDEFTALSIARFDDLIGQTISVGSGVGEPPGDSGEKRFAVTVVEESVAPGDIVRADQPSLLCNELEAEYQPIVLLLATALQIAEDAKLELGTTVVISGDCSFARLMGEVCKWWSQDRILLTNGEFRPGDGDTFTRIVSLLADDVQSILGTLLEDARTLSCIDFSGTDGTWTLMFEAAPTWSRFVACSPAGQPMTVDFYNNVHRKGATIIGNALQVPMLFGEDNNAITAKHLESAARILANRSVLDRVLGVLDVSIERETES